MQKTQTATSPAQGGKNQMGGLAYSVMLDARELALWDRNTAASPTAALLLDAAPLHTETLLHAEERLYRAYRCAADAANGRHLILTAPVPVEKNAPVGIRALIRRPALLSAYLSAALRASATARVSLLLPHVSTADEIAEVRRIAEQAMGDLMRRGLAFDELTESYISVGTPAAVILSRTLAEECDLLAVDADRLISLTVAALPDTPLYAELLQKSRKAVLSLIRLAIENAHTAHRRVAVSGTHFLSETDLQELLDLGVDALILPSTALPIPLL